MDSLSVLITPTLAPQYPDGTSGDSPLGWRLLILVRLGQEELGMNSQATSPDETARRLGLTKSLREAEWSTVRLEVPAARVRDLVVGMRRGTVSKAGKADWEA